jgi:hypothetical protein
MQQSKRWVVVALVALAGLQLSACASTGQEEADASKSEPASVEPVKGTDLSRVTLSPQAAKRLDIQTAPVRAQAGGQVIPYSAVLYDADGNVFVYTSPKRLVFIRAKLELREIRGNQAILSAGPSVGTEVVTVGAPELYGSEFGVEED